MKHFAKMAGALIVMALAFASFQAQAATKAQDREFNHLTTGYPLTGVHATVACETCHVGGVFIGTPRNCDGCHAVGKRIVATPKSTKHIVTDAPCDTCHFNTSTFFGARYNHGTAVPGQCENCHNGRIVAGKTSGHPVTTYTCDSCHRSSSWLPASWNHRDTASDCSTCHPSVAGPNNPGRSVSAAHLPMLVDTVNFAGNCKVCHTNYYTFASYYYGHQRPTPASTSCGNCHQNGTYTGKIAQVMTTAAHANYVTVGIAQCGSCHTSFGIGTFAAGKYDHSGKTQATDCDSCHAGHGTPFAGVTQMSTVGSTIHPASTTVGIIASGTLAPGCDSCHSMTGYSAWTGRYNHAGTVYDNKMAANSCLGCHDGSAPPIKAIPSNHTNAFTAPGLVMPAAQTNCTVCHSSTSTWTQMNHATALVAGGNPCKNCHDSTLNPPGASQKFSGMVQRPNGHKRYNNATQDCISCHFNTYSYWDEP